MAEPVTITVYGTPAPQGSKRAFVAGGRAVIVDDNKPALRSWRQDVKAAALDTYAAMARCPVAVTVTFFLARPKGHYGTGRNAAVIRASAPRRPAVKPDIDKLLRSTLDGLKEAGIYADDAQVVTITARKQYAEERPPGALISVSEIWNSTEK